ncbi:pentraxin fusion protein-like [Ptychodera flava]|uniref:pentraxin fusion protein-like n=1 Tax=Ptychodera flava TaxID=63121 RepID=UPI00396A042F
MSLPYLFDICTPNPYLCYNGACISDVGRCDSIQDCELGEDEIDCSGENNNLATGKPARQSSDHDASRGKASQAVDGSKYGDYFRGSCTHTRNDLKPWWKVDLLMTYRIIRVHIVNRDDCCYDRLIGAVVRAGNDEDHLQNPICAEPIGLDNRGEIVINCPGRMLGRYVSVDLPDRRDPLTICEAEVYGQDIRNCSDGDAAEFETLPCCPGYEVQQSKCVDIDECSVYQRFCEHECVNTQGSFYCECNHGYRLSTDRRSCQGENNNLATGKPARQSSDLDARGEASHAVDGDNF